MSADFICTVPDQPCNGETSDYFNSSSGWTELAASHNEFEKVELYGRSANNNAVCIRSECREYLLDLQTIYAQSVEPARSIIWGVIRNPGQLKKCMPFAGSLPADPLHRDVAVTGRARDFYRANDVYAKAGDTFDVQQADGRVFRFEVTLSDPKGDITYAAYISQVAVGAASTCA